MTPHNTVSTTASADIRQLTLGTLLQPEPKTYGSYSLKKEFWHITAAPHVMLRIKATFPRIQKGEYGTVRLKNTPESCRDLEWFLSRYPLLPETAKDAANLKDGSRIYQRTLLELEETRHADYVGREFKLADGYSFRDYQSVAAEVLLRRKGLLLADQVGLGKTVTAIGGMTCPEALPALVVCQPHMLGHWKEFINQYLPSVKVHVIKKPPMQSVKGEQVMTKLPAVDVYIITYSRAASWGDILQGKIKYLVLDECQEVRHDSSQKHMACRAIGAEAEYRLGLSATPIYNYGGEIFNILECLAPGVLGSREEFNREWCHFNGQKAILSDPEAFGTYLRDEFLMLRRNRTDVGRELPLVQRIVETVPHSDDALKAIEADATELAHRILQGTFIEKGEAAREFDMRLRQATGIAKAPAVAAFVRMLVESGEKVLLGAWHREVYDIYLAHLADLNPRFFTGAESPTQKKAAKDAVMSGDCPLLIMSLRSGVGVDGLQQEMSVVVFGELDWSPGVHEQFEGRLQRDGQQKQVTSFFLVSDSGSDPTVSNVLGLKKAQSNGMLDPGTGALQKIDEAAASRVKTLAENYLKLK